MDNELKVLIVDDSRFFCTMIERCLDGIKCVRVVSSVMNGIKAIEFIKSNPVDLVTLDLEMPDMDGIETLKAIEKINEEKGCFEKIGVVMLGSFKSNQTEMTIKTLEEGAFDFIIKPEYSDLAQNRAILKLQLGFKIRNFTTNRFLVTALN